MNLAVRGSVSIGETDWYKPLITINVLRVRAKVCTGLEAGREG